MECVYEKNIHKSLGTKKMVINKCLYCVFVLCWYIKFKQEHK